MFFSGIKKDTYTLSSTQVIEGDFFLLQEKLMTPGAFVIANEKGFISLALSPIMYMHVYPNSTTVLIDSTLVNCCIVG